ncbi:PepSY domain-containing protein [Paenibacillus sp. GSMTC-2017]|uniref:PepSY domain-containing protein n=1 Tax=Paenibacillus sp. GSMTC-2017 TaxID=2794350 RepID=UPI0018D7DE2D|nr:PepSY domain-containing protein [Paenibacillus sp. GSMTC-2017]MBH5320453.1 PepSY domain-containing protein [Paenibacillus sp. GSMTC-2017]
MNISKKVWLVAAVMAVSALLAALFTWSPWEKDSLLTEEEAIEAVLTQYPGQITDSVLKGKWYHVSLKSSTGVYEIVVNGNNGSIQSVTQLEGTNDPTTKPGTTATPVPTDKPNPTATPKPTEPNASKKPVDNGKPTGTSKPATEKPTLLTSSDAGKLATKYLKSKHINGVIEKVERGSENDYLVEIEVDDGREATVQVNAISGEIISIVWDDDEDDGSEEADDDV